MTEKACRFILSPPTIKTDVAPWYHTGATYPGASNNDQLTEYFGRCEFKRWLNEDGGMDSITNTTNNRPRLITIKLRLPSLKTIAMHCQQFKLIAAVMKPLTEADLNRWVEKLKQTKLCRWIQKPII